MVKAIIAPNSSVTATPTALKSAAGEFVATWLLPCEARRPTSMPSISASLSEFCAASHARSHCRRCCHSDWYLRCLAHTRWWLWLLHQFGSTCPCFLGCIHFGSFSTSCYFARTAPRHHHDVYSGTTRFDADLLPFYHPDTVGAAGAAIGPRQTRQTHPSYHHSSPPSPSSCTSRTAHWYQASEAYFLWRCPWTRHRFSFGGPLRPGMPFAFSSIA